MTWTGVGPDGPIGPSVVDQIGELGFRDLAEKTAALVRRQDALEKSLSETAQSLHHRCHAHTQLGSWRDCYMEPCSTLRRLMSEHVHISPADDPD